MRDAAMWRPLFDLPRNTSVVKHRCHGLTGIAQLAGAFSCAHSQIFYGCRKRTCCSSVDSRLDFAGTPAEFSGSAGDHRKGRHPDQIRA